MNDLKPLAYGYLRVPDDLDDNIIMAREQGIKEYAQKNGFDFGMIFHEDQTITRSGFADLMRELQRSDAHHVIVYSIHDLSNHPLVRHYMVDKLEEITRATIHIVDES